MKKKISEYLNHQLIIADLSAFDKHQAIRQLIDRIFEVEHPETLGCTEKNTVLDQVVQREQLQSTGLGNGIAFPHARVEGFSDLSVAIGINTAGIDWKSFDEKPCNIICLMISPTNRPYLILQSMALFSRFFSDTERTQKILKGLSPVEIVEYIRCSQLTVEKSVLAKDIIRPIEQKVFIEDSIEHAAHVMHLNRYDILPVINTENNLVGELSCLDIFSYGIPDFFSQLQTISFMRHLDPFEKYFKYQKDLKVKDICSKHVNTISEQATLMEIVFEMTVKNKSKLFVVHNGRLTGVVDRFTIIDKILFF